MDETNGPIPIQVQPVCYDTLDFIQVPGYPSAIETRSLPTLTRSYPRRFTFYVYPAASQPAVFALVGYPVYLTDSQSARFSLRPATMDNARWDRQRRS
jgi:hypothetical protein